MRTAICRKFVLPVVAAAMPLLGASTAVVLAAAPPEVVAQVDALQQEPTDARAFDALIARIDAAGEPRLKARAYTLHCQAKAGEDPEAMRGVADDGIALARSLGADAELGGLLLCRGYINESANRSEAAIADYTAAIEASTRGKMPGDAAQAQVLRGEAMHARGDYAAALRDMKAAYDRYVTLGNEPQQSYALNAIANFYADPRVADYDQALRYYRQLLAAHRAASREDEAATTRFNIASTLDRKGDHGAALLEFRSALSAYEAQKDAANIAETRRALAMTLVRMQRSAEALAMLEGALSQAGDDEELAARIRLVRGSALRRLGRVDEALVDFGIAQTYFERERSPRFLETIAGERAETYAAQGRWQEAFATSTQRLELSRELDRKLEQEVTARIRVQFDSERTERENAALQRENALRERSLRDAERIRALQATAIALGGALMAGLIWLAWRFRRRAGEMGRLAMTDELTGLLNRRAVLDRLRNRLDADAAAAVPLIMFDIDRFKSINDRLGHEIGDTVLCAVAEGVREALGDSGVVGRIGGEEFLVLLENADRDAAMAVAERLRETVEALNFDDRVPDLRSTISLGVSVTLPGRERVEQALKRVDLALYEAKEAGRNRAQWRDSE
jgi:diguanylate cyclase (GGDEF)-like protein